MMGAGSAAELLNSMMNEMDAEQLETGLEGMKAAAESDETDELPKAVMGYMVSDVVPALIHRHKALH